MSYSRWPYSEYYTYWCSTKVYGKQDELFACHTSLSLYHMFTYTECKEFIETPLKIRDRIKNVELSEVNLDELILYMKKFMYDVDLKYSYQLNDIQGKL
jgi:hypothetical protein